jgi:hypothetical protein
LRENAEVMRGAVGRRGANMNESGDGEIIKDVIEI